MFWRKELTAISLTYGRTETVEDKHLEIVNTQVIKIQDEPGEELFEGIEYVVQFELLSNYFGSGEPYTNTKMLDCVLIYKDGKVEVSRNDIFRTYMTRTYSTDFSNIIEKTVNYGSQFDQIIKLN